MSHTTPSSLPVLLLRMKQEAAEFIEAVDKLYQVAFSASFPFRKHEAASWEELAPFVKYWDPTLLQDAVHESLDIMLWYEAALRADAFPDSGKVFSVLRRAREARDAKAQKRGLAPLGYSHSYLNSLLNLARMRLHSPDGWRAWLAKRKTSSASNRTTQRIRKRGGERKAQR